MSQSKMNRRKFLQMSAFGAAGLAISSCTPAATPAAPAATPEPVIIEVTRVVEGETIVEQVMVTATPEPTKPPEAVADVLGTFPRRETLIAKDPHRACRHTRQL